MDDDFDSEFGGDNRKNDCFYCKQCYTIFSPEFNPTEHWFDKFTCPVCDKNLVWEFHALVGDKIWQFMDKDCVETESTTTIKVEPIKLEPESPFKIKIIETEK